MKVSPTSTPTAKQRVSCCSIFGSILLMVMLLSITCIIVCIFFSLNMFTTIGNVFASQRARALDAALATMFSQIKSAKDQGDTIKDLLVNELIDPYDFNKTKDVVSSLTSSALRNNKKQPVFLQYWIRNGLGDSFFSPLNSISISYNSMPGFPSCMMLVHWISPSMNITPGVLSHFPCYEDTKDLVVPPEPSNSLLNIPAPAMAMMQKSIIDMTGAVGMSSVFTPAYIVGCTSTSCLTAITYSSQAFPKNSSKTFDTVRGLGSSIIVLDTVSKTLESLASEVYNSRFFVIQRSTKEVIIMSVDLNKDTVDMSSSSGALTATFKKPELLSDDITRLAYVEIMKRYGDADAYSALADAEFSFYSSEIKDMLFVKLKSYVDTDGLDWIVVYAVPELSYIGTMLLWCIVTCVAAIILIVAGDIIGIVAAIIIVTPIYKLINQMKYVEGMKLELVKPSRSFFKEVASIQSAFYLMVDKLKEYKAFLPSHVLLRDFQIDNDTDQGPAEAPSVNESGVGFGKKHQQTHQHTEGFKKALQSVTSKSIDASLSLGLEQKEISMLGLQWKSMEEVITGCSPKDFVYIHGQVLDIVMDCARLHRGDVSTIAEDHFNITFNASVKVKEYAQQACACALKLSHKLQKLEHSLHEEEQFNVKLNFAITITTDIVYLGNIGSTNRRIFRVFGEVSKQNKHIAQLHDEWKPTVLIDDRTFSQIKEIFETRAIPDVRTIPKHGVSIMIPESTHDLRDFKKSVGMDEWMYELEEKERVNRHHVFAEAYTSFLAQDYSKAKEQFEKYLQMDKSDRMTIKLIEICNNM